MPGALCLSRSLARSLASFDERDMIEIAAAFVKTVFCLRIYARIHTYERAAPTRPSLLPPTKRALFVLLQHSHLEINPLLRRALLNAEF